MNVEKSGKFIRELRNQKKLTQKELAVLLHVTDKAVSKWETGKSMPDFQIMQRLCEILEISIPELLIGEKATTTMGTKECASLVMELADREKVKKAQTLTWYFGIGFLFLMLTI
ncbi:MAG: helix-turn-helix domain-containing protein, partial [Lachnospiraceae bacterium]|nr:helix-turn-helix domain-containing protein [Lachnospiraceae bacterium]